MSENIILVNPEDYVLKWAKCPNCDKDHLFMLVHAVEPPKALVFGALSEDVDDEGTTVHAFEFQSLAGVEHVILSNTKEEAVAVAEKLARHGVAVGQLADTMKVPGASQNRGMH